MYKTTDGRIDITNSDNSQRLIVRSVDLGTDYATGHLVDLESGRKSFLLGTEIHELADMFSDVSKALREADAIGDEKETAQAGALQNILDESRSSLPADTLFDGDPANVWRRKLDRIAAIAARALDEKGDDVPKGCQCCGSSGLDFGDPCGECGGTGLEVVTSSPGSPEHGTIEQEPCGTCGGTGDAKDDRPADADDDPVRPDDPPIRADFFRTPDSL